MLWEGRRLQDITGLDLRQVIDSGLEEHLQLEYKSALYEDNDRGRREFLLDICMFANAEGGVILIGVPEQRDADGQPTGVPDPTAPLGLDMPNSQAALQALDARAVAAIAERLPLESAPIDVGNGLRVLAIRVPNSPNKPHCVQYQGHVYFPSRRERNRYHMDVREIKELVMKTASRLEEAEQMLKSVFLGVPRPTDAPYLMIGILPVFWKEFLIDIRRHDVRGAVGRFDLADNPQFHEPSYTFAGLERRGSGDDITAQLRRNGLLSFSRRLPLRRDVGGHHLFYPTAVDIQLRQFMLRARELFQTTGLSAPYLLGVMLRTMCGLAGVYRASAGVGEEQTEPVGPLDYAFPVVLVDDLFNIDRIIRPICDQLHQTFGREASPCFNTEGDWRGAGG